MRLSRLQAVPWYPEIMKTTAANRRAEFDYEILERFEAGLVLSGHEVKSVRLGNPNLAGARAIIRGEEAYVVGLQIPSFQPGNEPDGYDAERTRKLLLSKEEIQRLFGKTQTGLTLIVTKLYSKNRLLKLEVALARGKKKYDKREAIKKKETQREIRRSL